MKRTITIVFIVVSLSAMLAGCFSEYRAMRQVEKAHVRYPENVTKYCGAVYPPTEATIDSIVYMQGESILSTDTFLVYDTLVKQSIKYVNLYQIRVDTVYKVKRTQVVNKANEIYIAEANVKLSNSLAASRKERQILYWVAAILGIYTLTRWIIRFWGIRLP